MALYPCDFVLGLECNKFVLHWLLGLVVARSGSKEFGNYLLRLFIKNIALSFWSVEGRACPVEFRL